MTKRKTWMKGRARIAAHKGFGGSCLDSQNWRRYFAAICCNIYIQGDKEDRSEWICLTSRTTSLRNAK